MTLFSEVHVPSISVWLYIRLLKLCTGMAKKKKKTTPALRFSICVTPVSELHAFLLALQRPFEPHPVGSYCPSSEAFDCLCWCHASVCDFGKSLLSVSAPWAPASSSPSASSPPCARSFWGSLVTRPLSQPPRSDAIVQSRQKQYAKEVASCAPIKLYL